jgi:positive regulator of sigma E activity
MTGAEGPRRIDVRIPHGMTLESGDEVSLTVESQQLLRAALFAYGIPLLAMLCALGAASISGMAASDLASIGIAFAGLAGGVAVSRYYLRRESACDHLIPVIDGHSDRTPA